ncbi:MAG: class F sortase [Propionibacteriaceae bacterium]|jgi:hypothetical protein|nr:class F sortase [Propionibacteriaceae bacterium]
MDEATGESENKKRKKGILSPALTVFAVLCLLFGLGTIGYQMLVPPEGASTDMAGNWVKPEESISEKELQAMAAEPEIKGKRFQVPSVGLDAPLGAMNLVGDTINPPGFHSVFWIRNMGVSVQNADKGTVYLVTHSLRNGGMGPGNYLIDVENGKGRVGVGADMYIDKVKYTVTEVVSVPKSKIGSAAGVWDQSISGRAIVITCLQRVDNGASRNNIIIIGKLSK